MALIKCIECGKEISSFAPQCPYCGCPAQYQTCGNSEKSTTTDIEQLINPQDWMRVQQLVNNHEIIEAKELIAKLLDVNYHKTKEIADKITPGGKLPVSFILEKYPSQGVASLTTSCSACGKTISAKAETCPHCGQVTGVHVCPKCGSANTATLTGFDKVAYTALFGVFAAKTVLSKYWCKDCGFEF